MKIAVTSDIHLEFGDWMPINPENADVLILGGDIIVASDLYGTHKTERYLSFFENCKRNYEHVIYLMGNHEHYNGDFAESHKLIKDPCDQNGIHFLNGDAVTINGITFVGGTMWTDMNGEDPITMTFIKESMNDFRCVRNSNRVTYNNVPIYEYDEDGRIKLDKNGYGIKKGERRNAISAKFSPADAVEEHKKFLDFLSIALANKTSDKYVVCTHHCPSRRSTHPRYASDTMVNGGYSSSLDLFIEDHPEIALWTHGHTHEEFDYVIGNTRVVCNPRGYVGHERRSDKDEPYLPKVIEV